MGLESKLYQPIKLGRFTLKNRFTVAPYGSALHERDGSAGPKLMAHLRNLARGGAAMVTIGSGNINKSARSGIPLPKPNDPMLVGNYVNISELMHQFDCKVSQQLFGSYEMLAPTEEIVNNYTKDDIARWRQEYADSAFNVMQAGFDFIMIHGGHGNGPSMMFSSEFNHRTDEYGGSFENRCRFALEVLDAIRDRCGDRIGIEYRISAEEMTEHGITLEESIAFAKAIQDRVDLMHVSRGMLEVDELHPFVFTPTYFPRGINAEFAAKFKEALDIPVSVVGGADVATAERIVDAGQADVVVAARNFIADPLSMRKACEGRPEDIRPCIRCNVCIGQTHARLWDLRCSVNPLAGREYLYPTVGLPAARSKKVVLIGGGPANLECARTAAARGHHVVLIEREAQLGGKLVGATRTEFKRDLRNYLEWSIRGVENDPNIEVRLNTLATPELVRDEAPDALVVAIGGEPIIPRFSASGTDKVLPVGEVEGRIDGVGKRVIIAGGGLTGLEAALELAQAGRDVTVVDMIPASALGRGGTPQTVMGLLYLLREQGVRFLCEKRIVDVAADGMIVEDLQPADGAAESVREVLPYDTAVVSFGIRTDPAAVEAFKGLVPETYIIGDCSPVGGTVWQAVRSGFDIGMEL